MTTAYRPGPQDSANGVLVSPATPCALRGCTKNRRAALRVSRPPRAPVPGGVLPRAQRVRSRASATAAAMPAPCRRSASWPRTPTASLTSTTALRHSSTGSLAISIRASGACSAARSRSGESVIVDESVRLAHDPARKARWERSWRIVEHTGLVLKVTVHVCEDNDSLVHVRVGTEMVADGVPPVDRPPSRGPGGRGRDRRLAAPALLSVPRGEHLLRGAPLPRSRRPRSLGPLTAQAATASVSAPRMPSSLPSSC